MKMFEVTLNLVIKGEHEFDVESQLDELFKDSSFESIDYISIMECSDE